MSRYWVFHDWGTEGWKPVGVYESVLEAAEAREADIANGGGRVEIFEHIPVLAAYRQADYQLDARKRTAVAT